MLQSDLPGPGTYIPHMHAGEGFRLDLSGEGTAETVLVQVSYLLAFAAVFFVLRPGG